MKKLSGDKLRITKRILFAVVGGLVAVTLLLSFFSRNIITRSREEGGYITVEDVIEISRQTDAGTQTEYRFTLNKIDHAETLAFFVDHYDAEVYIGDECAYTLTAARDDSFSTTGCAWIMIPLYESDNGKEVRVLLSPHYKNYRSEVSEFLLGSEIAVHNVTLHRALPVLVLCLCVVFAGLLLVCLAAYNTFKGVFSGRLYALGLMAISAGLWRISYDRLAYLLLENHSVFIYSLSIISLMAMALSMLNSLDVNEKGKRLTRIFSCIYSAVYIVQLVLQITGTADLRQTLPIVHITIIAGAVAFAANGILLMFKPKTEKKTLNVAWVLAVGVAIDLVMYYIGDPTFKMLTTLGAILCYTIIEGVGLIFTYVEQKNAVEEMQIQLALSRTTTMMSQIRSHFVFNILNAISGMCKYDPEMADDTIVRF